MKFPPVSILLPALLIAVIVSTTASAADDGKLQRIVLMGDSITDGHTYALMIEQAIHGAGQPAAKCINAGVASDTAADMRKRVERDVFVHHPTLVTLSVGVNDVNRGVTLEDFERDVRAIVAQVRTRQVPIILLTTTILGPKLPEKDAQLAGFNAVLRKIAKAHDAPVAEVNELMQKARSAGQSVNEDDQIHINQPGYRLMARAVLDAMGQQGAAVPESLKLDPMPGLITAWRILPKPEGTAPLDEQTLAGLKPDDAWKSFSLPEKDPLDHWWREQERQRGFAQSLDKLVGPAKLYWGIVTIDSSGPRRVYFNTGAELQTVWVNGKRIYKNEGWTGWHAGKQRIPVELSAGANTVVIEAAANFFLSVTDNDTW